MAKFSHVSRSAKTLKWVIICDTCGSILTWGGLTHADQHVTLVTTLSWPTNTWVAVNSINACWALMTGIRETFINLFLTKSPSIAYSSVEAMVLKLKVGANKVTDYWMVNVQHIPGAQSQENVPIPSTHWPLFSHPWFKQSSIFSSQ